MAVNPRTFGCWLFGVFFSQLFLGINKSWSILVGQGNSLLLIYSLIATPGLRGEHRYHQEIGTRDPPAHKCFWHRGGVKGVRVGRSSF